MSKLVESIVRDKERGKSTWAREALLKFEGIVGGRESGVIREDDAIVVRPRDAAADPAACPHGWADPSHCLNCTAKAHDDLKAANERIRALEAEVRRQLERWIAADKATKSLGKALGERAQQLDDAIARAEHAEALISCQQPGSGPCLTPELPCMKHQLAKSGARIAELTKTLEATQPYAQRIREAREREED